MLVAFDSSFLIPLFDSRVGDDAVLDPRIKHLLFTISKEKGTIIIPAPALSELLIGAGEAAPRYLSIINASPRFKIAPFGTRAAVEAAAAHREAIKAGDKKEGSPSWNKVKFDRQIVSIAIVEGADSIYSNDDDIRRISVSSSVEVIRLDDMPEPPPPEEPGPEKPMMGSLFDNLSDNGGLSE
jgi:predicted nucleic acid-binding protein